MIKKVGGKFRLESKSKGKNGAHKNLGTYTSKDAAKHREQQRVSRLEVV